MHINSHYTQLPQSYLFSEIAGRVKQWQAENPGKRPLRLGIGDVTLPLVPAVTQAMGAAVEEMGQAATFRGYGEEQGYAFLREAICVYYAEKHVALTPEEVFVSDGAKSDLGNILDLFSAQNTVAVPNPVYPVYVDTNLMAGRKIVYISATPENGFLPMPAELPGEAPDIIYLCSPNNPTGAVYTLPQLETWVEYALQHGAVILFDSAYEAFVQDAALPTSIYQVPGATECAIEFCSLSKTAGFTGVRCGYTVVPTALQRQEQSLNRMWLRRQTTKFNGVSYIVQRGAQAVFTLEGRAQTKAQVAQYLENARLLREGLTACGVTLWGGENAPYVWLQCPKGMNSWQFFDWLLNTAGVVGTPGSGFGSGGEGCFRLSAFAAREDVQEAMRRLQTVLRNS